jgi:selenide,water dikinase
MVPGLFAGHYELDDCTIDLQALATRAEASLVLASAVRVDPGANEVSLSNGEALPYEVLSINVGSVARTGTARGVEQHATVMRPLERAVKAWNDVLFSAREGHMATVTVVGGGAAGVELALAMNYRFRRDLFEAAPHVRVIADTPTIVPTLARGAAARLQRCMRKSGVEAQLGSAVTEVGDGFIRLESGLQFATDAVFWTGGAVAPPWLRESGFATDQDGFLLTNDLLQSPSHPNVFGAGDCVNELGHPLPKAGVFAVRAGPALAANVLAALEHRPQQPHIPSRRYLALVSAGERYAVGAWNGLAWGGSWAWAWKDRIDRSFVARYRAGPGRP